jgi:hypothetical protein
MNKPQEIYEVSLSNLQEDVKSRIPAMLAYKKVANHIKPVATTLPEKFHIVCCIPCDPLSTMPTLPTHPPEFVSTTCYTLERKKAININPDGFL